MAPSALAEGGEVGIGQRQAEEGAQERPPGLPGGAVAEPARPEVWAVHALDDGGLAGGHVVMRRLTSSRLGAGTLTASKPRRANMRAKLLDQLTQ
jgi:hypothetical protein